MKFIKFVFVIVIYFISLKTYGAENYMCTLNEKDLDGNIIETKITLLREKGKNSYLFVMAEGSIPVEVLYEDTNAIYFHDTDTEFEIPVLYVWGINKKTGFLAATGMVLEEILPSVPGAEVDDNYISGICDIN